MRRIAVLIASAVLNASTVPSLAAECTSSKDICTHAAIAQGQLAGTADKEKSCRDYAASFYQSVTLRQVAVQRVEGARVLVALDSVINAFNDLLATKCGG
ncbi:hypothetical protein H8A95_18845 [Bradyrhizobium sp. Pear76]|uniref:hypothetical protein n=1 Tax=Bradyrhizobium oropedii TaxID=1571201 RepID=UPI001E58ED22|nr:hypothetical protein [Bradyrhizobium oropedii]MCC8964321.1 hypothetical protein [Bradyrhizobium oropedii]